MPLLPSVDPKNNQGAAILSVMETIDVFDRPVALDELAFDKHHLKHFRQCWDADYLHVVKAHPMRYEITMLGREKLGRGRHLRAAMVAREAECEQVAA